MTEPEIPQPPLPRDKDSLLREVDARIRIKDIKSLDSLREQIDVKWWEPLLLLLLFASALGFLAFMLLLLINPRATLDPRLARPVLIWSIPLVLSIVLSLEVVLRRLNSIRQLLRRLLVLLETLQKQLDSK